MKDKAQPKDSEGKAEPPPGLGWARDDSFQQREQTHQELRILEWPAWGSALWGRQGQRVWAAKGPEAVCGFASYPVQNRSFQSSEEKHGSQMCPCTPAIPAL